MTEIDYVRANPAGNVTALVLSEIPGTQRVKVGRHLMDVVDPTIEQVGFIEDSGGETLPHLHMMGGEFCGNAARSFGLYLAKAHGKHGQTVERVRVSGAKEALDVFVDVDASRARLSLTPAREIREFDVEGKHLLVELEGIHHLIVTDRKEDRAFVDRALSELMHDKKSEAYGVLFLDLKKCEMTPYVYVVAAQTLYREGSCGSGSFAVASAYRKALDLDAHVVRLAQPAGVIELSVTQDARGESVPSIGGVVEMREIQHVVLAQ